MPRTAGRVTTVGDRVTLRNLVSRPDLNGVRGTVRALGDRIEVVTDGGEGVRVKPENVEAVVDVTITNTPEGTAPNLPYYAAWLHDKHPSQPFLMASEAFDLSSPIDAMSMADGTVTQLFLEEETEGADLLVVYEGRASALQRDCRVGAYRALSSSQQALLDAHGGVALVEYKKMRGDPRNCPALFHAVVFPDSLNTTDFLQIKADLVEAARQAGTAGFIVRIAPAP